jgi:hypothetical protein
MTLVTEAYVHAPKQAWPADDFRHAGSRLKWYDLARERDTLSAQLEREARAQLGADAGGGTLALSDDRGFVLLHHCGSVAFLIVCVWRSDNELWKTVYIKDLERGGAFVEQEYRGIGAAFCVWELGVVCHEQQAWTRYLYGSRDAAALERYMGDHLDGAV